MIMFLINYVIYIFQNIFLQMIILHLFQVKAGKLPLFLSGLLVNVVFDSFFLLLPLIPSLSLASLFIWAILLILSYWLIHRAPFWKSVVMGVFQHLLINGVEYLCQLYMNLFKVRDFIYANPVLGHLNAALIGLGIYLMIRKVRVDMSLFFQRDAKGKHKIWIIYVIYLLLYSSPNIIDFEKNLRTDSTRSIDIYNLFVFLSFFIFNLIYIRNVHKTYKIEEQLEVQQLYMETQEKALSELRSFKHDFANILNMISGYADLYMWEQLEVYIRQLNREFLRINTTEIVNSELKQLPILYSLILSKMNQAEIAGVDFRLSIQTELDLKYCDLLDFTRIIGILLDNALDAAEDSSSPFIEFEVDEYMGMNRVIIRNSCNGEVDLTRIFEEGYTSKANHSGIGLSKVNSIIQKYRKRGYAMELKTDCVYSVFTQVLFV